VKPGELFRVRYTQAARDDLLRLFDFLLERAQTAEDLGRAQDTVDAVRSAVETQLPRAPFVYRKVGSDSFLRELVVPFAGAGYVVLYRISAETGAQRTVDVLAVRHQREDDYD